MNQSIHAITVSKNYADMLAIVIPENARHFEKWVIVTQEDDHDTIKLVTELNKQHKNLQLVYYPLCHNDRAKTHVKHMLSEKEMLDMPMPGYKPPPKGFNKNTPPFDKGGAIRTIQKYYMLTEAQHELHTNNDTPIPEDYIPMPDDALVLILDSDILLPSNTKQVVDNIQIDENTIYGAERVDCLFRSDTQVTEGTIPYYNYHIDGFFQLYKHNQSALHNLITRRYKRSYSAEFCDFAFTNTFENQQVLPEIKCRHIGLPRVNWNGRQDWSWIDDTDDKVISKLVKDDDLATSNNRDTTLNIIRNHVRYQVSKNDAWANVGPKYLYIIGFERCGTESLRHVLQQHPHVEFYRTQHDNPGPHDIIDKHMRTGAYNCGVTWAFCQPEYLTDMPGLDYYVNIKRLLRHNTTTKGQPPQHYYIVLIRDPLDRAISEWKHYMDNMPSSFNWNWPAPGKTFETNIQQELESLTRNRRHVKHTFSRFLTNGLYDVFLKPLYNHVGEHSIIPVCVEQLKKDPETVQQNIFNKLGMEWEMKPIPVLNTSESDFDISMSNDIRNMINNIYKPTHEYIKKIMT